MHDYLAAWNRHDPDAVAGFFSEDGLYDDRGASEVARGRPVIREHVAGVMRSFPDIRFGLVRAAHGDDFTCGEWTCRMTQRGALSGLRPTGRSVSSAGVDVARLDDAGRIAHLVSYYDAAAIMRELGVLPAKDSGTERVLVRLASLLQRARRR